MELENTHVIARIKIAKIMANGKIAKLMQDILQYDTITFEHSINVAHIVAQIMIKKGEKLDFIDEVIKGALLHDYGKTLIPYKILSKKEPLTSDEFCLIKTHPQLGVDAIRSRYPELLSPIVEKSIFCHHERKNGSGYPLGICKIPKYVEVISAVDAYEAMTAKRTYGERYSSEYSIASLKYQKFDCETIYALVNCEEK